MVIMLAANLLNIVLNWVFVNGLYGMPEMGAEGSAWATFGVRVLMVVSIMIYVWWMVDYEKYGVRQPPPNSWRAGQENRRLGYASGLSIGIENTAFNSLSIIAGMLGTMALATHTISINFFGLCFMFGLGVGTSTAVLVGNANGAKNWPLLQRLIWVGLGTQMFLMIVTAGLLSIFSQQVARIYTDEPELIVQVGGVLAYASLGILLDAGQSLMAQTLRARGDAWSPTLIHFFCFGLVMIPFSYVSAVHFERGVYGLFDGLILGTLLSFILGIWRNRVLNHRMRNVSMSEILSPETEIPDPVA
jgi:MATE family multidrug resistance protein